MFTSRRPSGSLANQILDEDLRLNDREFRRKYPQLRDRSKPLVLGIIYGKTVHGIAMDLGISRGEAQALGRRSGASTRSYARGWSGREPSQFAAAMPTSRGFGPIPGGHRFAHAT